MKNFNFFDKLFEQCRTLRRVGMVLVMCLTVCGNAWGTDFTFRQIINGTASGNITVSVHAGSLTANSIKANKKEICNVKDSVVQIGNSAGKNYDTCYVEIKAAAGYTIASPISIVGSNTTDKGEAYNACIVFWTGDASNIYSSITTASFPSRTATSSCDIDDIEVPAGTKTIRIYKKATVNTSTKKFGSGTNYGDGQTIFIKSISVSAASSCTAPNHVEVTPTSEAGNYGWRYSIGETLKLTATPYSSAGTGSPITSGITGYQWQKYVGSTWTDLEDDTYISGATTANLQISNLTTSNGGSYRCNISTGATCTTSSDGYFVRIFTLYGGYSGGSYSNQPIVWTGEKRGTVTINLNASSSYKFKFTDNDGKWYGNSGTISKDFATEDDGTWGFGTSAGDATLSTGSYGGGDYVLTVDITHFDDGGSKYVNLRSVVYPKKTTYLQLCSDWKAASAKYAAYYWKGDDNGWTDFMETFGCDGDIRYADIPVWATNAFFVRFNPDKSSTGNNEYEWNRSGDNESTLPTDGKDYYNSLSVGGNGKYYGSWGTFSPTTYTISFEGNGSDGGSTMSNVTAIPCDENRTLAANTWTKTGHTFAGWVADVDVKVGGSTKTAGTVIDDEETIQNIRSNITLTAQWSVKSYDLTWNLGGGTTTSAGTGIASGVSSNTTSSIAFGTSLSAPTVTKTGYNFSSWSPSVASTMPAANTTYTAQWTANQYSVSHSLSYATKTSGATGANAATYGTNYTAVFAAAAGYTLPDDVTVTVGGSDVTANCTWDQGTGELTIPAAYVTGAIVITVTGEEEPSVDCSAEWGDWGSPVENFPTNTSSTISGDVAITLTTTLTAGSFYLGGRQCGSAYHFDNGDYVDISINKGEITAVKVYTWNGCADVFRVQFFSTTSYDAEAVLGYQDFSGSGQNNTDLQVANAPAGSKFARISRVGGTCWDNYLYRLIVDAKTAPTLTALEDGTRYDVADMVPAGTTISSTEQTPTGLSANTKFYLVGPTAMAVKDDAKTVDGISFANSYYFKSAATLSSNTPTDRAIKFIIPSAGTLTAWVRQSAKVCLSKEGVAGSALGSGNSDVYDKYTADVTAGTYYLYATGGSTTLYAVKFDATAATYSIAYDCDGATSGCPSNVAEATNLPNPLPDAPVKTGYVFGGWYTNSGKTTPAVAGAALTGNTTLYAKWTRDVDQAKWGTGYNAFPNNSSDKRKNVTVTTSETTHQSGDIFSGNQYYNFGDGDYIDINLDEGYEITDIKTCSYNDPWRPKDGITCNNNDGCEDVDTKLYINFSSAYTYSSSAVLNAEPILLTPNTYGRWTIETYKNTLASIPGGAKSARIFADGSYDFGADLFYLEVERTALDCTPSTVAFAAGGGTGTAPSSRIVCGEMTLPSRGSLAKKGNTFTGWSDGSSTYKEGDTYDVTEDVTFTAQWSPFVVPVVTGLEIDGDYALTWSIPGKLNLSTATLSDEDNYFIKYQTPAGSQSYNAATEELTITYTAAADYQKGVAIPFTGNNLESITYDYKGHRVFPAVVKSADETLYWEYDVVTTSADWTRVTRTPSTIYPNEGTVKPLPTAKAITFCANPNASKTDEPFYIRNVFYHCTGMIDVDHVVLMRKEGSAATDTTEAGTSVLLYSGILSHYTDETIEPGKTYYYTIFSVHADGTLSAGTTQSVVVPKDDLDITYAAGTASSVTHNSATLPFTMSATTGVASVTLKVYKNSDNSLVNTIEGVTAATSGSGNVTGLDAETTYYFTVTPIGDATHNDGTESGKSATFTTSAAPTLSALVAGTLYEVPDMIPSGASLTSDDKFFEGLSANTKFTLIGSASSSTTPKVNNNSSNDKTIDGITFDDGSMWFKGNAIVSENIPSTFGLSFIVPSAGKLYLYFDDDDASTNIKLAKSGTSGSKPTVSSGYSVVDVTSGTYYMYGTSTSAPYSFYGLKFVPTYDITLHDNNGGSNNGSAAVAVNGTTLLDIDAPTRSGYAVTGYYAEAECTTPVADAEGNLEANVTVSAVDWTDGDGKWIKGSGATLYAKWGVVYTVAFNTNGGSSVDAITQTSEGASIMMPAAPTKDGYTFNGWQIGSTYAAGASYTPTANVTAYATWKAECGVIKWDFTNRTEATLTANKTTSYTADDGVTEMRYSAGSSDKIVAYDSKKSIDGHLYENGNTGSGTVYDIDDITNVGKTRLIRLFVEPGSGTLRINCNGTNGEYKVLDGSASGTTLISSLSANITSSSITLTTSPLWIETTTKGYINDIRWTPSSTVCYYVTYNGNGADGGYVNDPEAHSSGDNVTTLANSFTRTGCTFTGWNTAADGSGTAYAAGGTIRSISGNVTLYAQWKITVSENKNLSEYTSDALSTTDIVVTNGATLTVTEDTEVRNITVETGSTLNVSVDGEDNGVTFTVNSLSLKGGLNSSCTEYDMPRVYINSKSSLEKSESTVNFDISVDQRNYYPIAVPFPVEVAEVDYVNSTMATYSIYGKHFVIKEYDGASRAENGAIDDNWVVVSNTAGTKLLPGKGYILTAISKPAYGGGVIRFPMSFTDAWTTKGEQATVSAVTKNTVAVEAYEGTATEGGKNSNKGWNMLGVPYMSCFAPKVDEDYTITHSKGDAFIIGKLNFITGDYSADENIYVTVPTHDFSEYKQFSFADGDTKLLPGWCFFVQVDEGGTLTFDAAGQEESSSLPIYARREEMLMPTVKTGIILSSETASDKTTFLISDKYSVTDYEINADLEKMFGNGYTLATYSLAGTTRLAYNAMSRADAANVIPIGYRAPAEGEYTFAINPRYAENGDFERIDLIDYETGFVTNLLQSSYTFTSDRTQSDSRFALNVVPQKETPTDVEPVTGDGLPVTGARKVIIDNKIYIIRGGRMYDATGRMVK